MPAGVVALNLIVSKILKIRRRGAGDEECGEAGGVDCVICMNAVDAKAPRERTVTPCNHFFHRECLERWMKVKMECPTCRGALKQLCRASRV